MLELKLQETPRLCKPHAVKLRRTCDGMAFLSRMIIVVNLMSVVINM